MPPELKEKLFESAKNMNRSLNAEIVARLEQSFLDNPVVDEDYRRRLLAVTSLVLAEQLSKDKPDFFEAISKIVDAI